MTTPAPTERIDPSAPSTGGGVRPLVILIAAAVFVVAAIAGAYLDWLLWLPYDGLIVTLAAGGLLLIGGVLALFGHATARRVGLAILVGGLGLVAGQNLGPSREALIYQSGGMMTLRLESPVVAVATGTAECTNVGSGTEFAVEGDLNMRLEALATRLGPVSIRVGDRWDAVDGGPHKDGVRLVFMGTAERIPDSGIPTMVVMEATGASSLTSTFSNDGGSMRFGGLAPRVRTDLTGEPLDLAGTLEWTCGVVVAE
jgi:hypothetical protein